MKPAAQTVSGSSKYAEFEAENTSAAYPFNVYGLEGIVPSDTGGVGVLGYGGAPESYGVYGVTLGYNGIGVYGAGDGPTPAPSATPSSTQQSTGVAGDSHSGDGVFGSTEFPNASDPSYGESPVSGVMGVDTTTAGNENVGVVGITTNGAFGVAGLSADADVGSKDVAAIAGVYGEGTVGSGVFGLSKTGYGGSFNSGNNFGVVGLTTSKNASGSYGGNAGTDPGAWGSNTYVNKAGGNYVGVYGYSAYGVALEGYSKTGGSGNYSIGLLAEAQQFPIVAENSSGNTVFSVDVDGNVTYTGSLQTSARTRDGYTAKTFTSHMSSPTVEDVGTGDLVNGEGVVRLDPALVEQMDLHTPYHVFLTPDGDTRGLYVASKTAQGFIVRETQGGHGTLSFDYRVVAPVDGQAATRATLARGSAGPAEVKAGALVDTAAESLAASEQSAKLATAARLARASGRAIQYVPRASPGVSSGAP